MSAVELINACKNNQFPTISTMSKYGMDGNGGTNPLYIFKCYREAVLNDGLTNDQIENYFKKGKINQLILENCDSVKYLDCYEKVLQKGGIKSSWLLPQVECSKCKRCAVHEDDVCSNCGTIVKK